VSRQWPKSVDEKVSIPTFITDGSDCRSSKEFLEAGKKRLAGDTAREATAPEVQSIKSENEALKQLVAELSLKIGS
jgi:hypothetical protein